MRRGAPPFGCYPEGSAAPPRSPSIEPGVRLRSRYKPLPGRGSVIRFFVLPLTPAGCGSLLGRFLGDAEPFLGRGALARGFLGFSGTHTRFRAPSRAFFAVRLRVNAEFVPVSLGQVDVVELRGLLDVSEGQGAVRIGDFDNLIEARDRVPHVPGICQRLFPLLGKRENG